MSDSLHCPNWDVPADIVIKNACQTNSSWVQCTPNNDTNYFCTSKPENYLTDGKGLCLPQKYDSLQECLQKPSSATRCPQIGDGCDFIPSVDQLGDNPPHASTYGI